MPVTGINQRTFGKNVVQNGRFPDGSGTVHTNTPGWTVRDRSGWHSSRSRRSARRHVRPVFLSSSQQVHGRPSGQSTGQSRHQTADRRYAANH